MNSAAGEIRGMSRTIDILAQSTVTADSESPVQQLLCALRQRVMKDPA